MKRVDIRKNKWGAIFFIAFFVPGSVYGFYVLFMTEMFADKLLPKFVVPIILIYCLYYSFKRFIDLVNKKVVLSFTTNGIEIFEDTLKTFDWSEIKTIELEKRETNLGIYYYILNVASDQDAASIYLTGLDIGHRKIIELTNEYSKGTAANKMHTPWRDSK